MKLAKTLQVRDRVNTSSKCLVNDEMKEVIMNTKSETTNVITASVDTGVRSVFVTGIIGQECEWEIEAYGVDTHFETHNFKNRDEVAKFARDLYSKFFLQNTLPCNFFQNGEKI
jgi:hypothetical protein